MTWRPSAAQFAEQRDGFGAHQRIEAVQRLIQHQHPRIVRDGLRQLDPLPHAFAVAGDFAVRGFGHAHALDRDFEASVRHSVMRFEPNRRRNE